MTPAGQLDRRYDLLDVIGEGRTARIHRAIHVATRRSVAVKLLRRGDDGAADRSRA